MARALLYDIHANLPALEAVLADADTAGATSFVLGGDYTLFGAWPQETLAVLEELDAVRIRGNGERWTARPAEAPDDDVVQRAIDYCRKQLGDAVEELAELPERAKLGDVLFCHGSPRSDVETFMPEPMEDEEKLLDGAGQPVIVFGHSHLQFSRRAEERLLVNPGSVGMPLDGDTRAAYALLSRDAEFELRRVEYDVASYVVDMRDRLGAPLRGAVDTLVRRIEHAAFED